MQRITNTHEHMVSGEDRRSRCSRIFGKRCYGHFELEEFLIRLGYDSGFLSLSRKDIPSVIRTTLWFDFVTETFSKLPLHPVVRRTISHIETPGPLTARPTLKFDSLISFGSVLM